MHNNLIIFLLVILLTFFSCKNTGDIKTSKIIINETLGQIDPTNSSSEPKNPPEIVEGTLTEEDEDKVEDWKLVKEFNFENGLGEEWSFDIGNGIGGWGNNELQYYTKGENLEVKDGKIILTARREDRENLKYTSTKITTKGKFEFKYGRVEVRAKMPGGRGVWPAVWMLGTNFDEIGWPACGEIDVLEVRGQNATRVEGTIHGPNMAGANAVGYDYELGPDVPNLQEDFHIYTIEWDDDEVEWYIDGKLYHILSKYELMAEGKGDSWVFDHPFYLLVNVAVGGWFAGNPTPQTPFPQSMVIDYIRVYEDVNPETISGLEVWDSENEKIKDSPVYPKIEEFSNGNFNRDINNWVFWSGGGASGDAFFENQMAKIDVYTMGQETWGLQFFQGYFIFEANKKYAVSFDAKSSIKRDIGVVIDDKEFERVLEEYITLGTTMKNYQFIFETTEEVIGRFNFLMGNIGIYDLSRFHSIYYDNISIKEIK